jgi:hypothetical protein
MFMSIEQLLLVEKQRRQQEADLVRIQFPEQECFEEKKAGVKFSQWFGSILVRTGERILRYAN